MIKYHEHFSPNETPQTRAADPRQVENNAGGYTFKLEPLKQLERWLILGSEGGTYYATEKKLTVDNALVVVECLNMDPKATVDLIVEVSSSGRAPKNDPAIFAFALAMTHPQGRKHARGHLSEVCRTGTHLFQFVEAVSSMRGWGRSLKREVASWYTGKSCDALAYQVAKYGQRGGMTHKRVLRRAHPESLEHNPVLRYVTSGADGMDRTIENRRNSGAQPLPEYLEAFEELKHATKKRAVELIEKHRFTREMVNPELIKDRDVWAALLPHMPITALIRTLNRMTAVGLLGPMGEATGLVCKKLVDTTLLHNGRVHPVLIIQALMTYKLGHGVKGSLTWQPVREIIDALDSGFYESFKTIDPSNKRTMLAIDTSASMTWPEHNVSPGFSSIAAAAVMAMVTARTEPKWMAYGFAGNRTYYGVYGHSSTRLVGLDISPRERLDDVIHSIMAAGGGGTDCSLPMLWATENNVSVDVFHVYTDNDTWAGRMHPHEALKAYRQKTGIDARLAVIGMTPTPFTIADPSDPRMLDVVGFDSAAASVIADFAKGD